MRIRVLRRKCFLFLLLMFAVGLQAMATESCGIVFNLHDSYGDGWNGNKLVVSDGNALNEELTINNGSSASFTLIIAEGSHVTLSWIEGAFSDECSFSVQFENGYPIYESGNLSGTSYEFNLNCDDANTPVTITVASGNDEAGSVSGGGEFVCGETCTVTATPNEGYSFWCWVVENRAVSTEANYTFTVAGPRDLMGVFRPVSNANYVVFVDPNVEAVCLQQGWDTDEDGYLSYDEAAAVTDLGSAFQGNETITSFDELQYFTGLTSIGEGSFQDCTILVSIEIPNSVTSIGDRAFAGCDNLNSIVLPETLISIGSYAFMTSGPDVSSGLTSITIPNMVTSIGDRAFAGLGLTSITIPSSVTSIGINPFAGCTSLETITVETGNQVYDSPDNCNAIIETGTNTLLSGCSNTTIPNTVTNIGMGSFAFCSNLTTINIPNSVISIDQSAFEGCTSLVSIEIPSSVTSIGDYAFAESGLTSITIPNSVTSIGNYAFAWSGLTTITVLAATPPTIGRQAFQDVDKSIPVYVRSGSIDLFTNAEGWNEFTNFIALTNIEFADANVKALCVANWDTDGNGELSFEEAAAVTDLGAVFQYNEDIMSFDELQYFTGITSVVFENGGFAEGCFMGCPNLTSLTLPSSVTAIGDYAFYECTSLTSINIPNSVTAIGESAFEFAGLIAVNIPNSVTSIGISAFNGCESLVSATIPDALTTIEENVFGGCSSLTSINIPGSVTSIGDGAFSWCIGLASMTVNATTPPVLGGTSVFDEVDKSIPVYVPGGTTNAYRAAEGWDEFFNYIETSIFFADANVKQICVDNWDTDGDGELSYVEAALVTDLGYAFRNNEAITSFDELQYFTGLTSIGDEAFGGCTSLVSIEIPNSVTSIGNFAFAESGLATIIIPNSVTSIGIGAFSYCANLNEISVDSGNPVYDSRDNCNAIIETATNTLINGCSTTIIPNSVTSIGEEAFVGCSNLTSIIIPNSVTSIGDQAFVVCTNLTSLIIPSSVQSIGNYAFAGCTGLTSMIIFNTNVEMGNDVFDDITIPETLFVSASASPADGGGLFGLSQGGGGSAFVGTLNEFSIEFAPQGSGELSSSNSVLLIAKPNEGWQFVGWQINGELVSDEASLMFRAFGEFAFEAHFEPCGAEPDPELLSGRFSVSDCSTIGFARSNTIMSMSDLNMGEFALYGVAIPGMDCEIGENQWDRMTYDASALNGNGEAYRELFLTGVDIFPSFFIKNNIDCWHIPTWREWDYMLNQRETASGIRFAYGIVNEVSGLIVLPDDWEAATYTLSNVNEIGNYDNNVIDAATWTTVLEPAGAVFLPSNGYMAPGQLIQETSDGQAVGAYPGLLFSPSGEFMMGQMEGFPMTGPMTLMLDMMTMAGMMNSSSSGWFGGTSVRLAKAMDNSTATVVLATNDAERGTVTGGGEFVCQQECTVTAMANDGYVFMYWLENGVAISVAPEYSFKLLGDRNLTAVFAPATDVCQLNVIVTAPSNASMSLDYFGLGVSLVFDDSTPSYFLPFATVPESLELLDLLLSIIDTGNGNSNKTYTFTINTLTGSNGTLDVLIPDEMQSLMQAQGGSLAEMGVTFSVGFENGETIVENTTELPIDFHSDCDGLSYRVTAESNNPEYGSVNGDASYEEVFDYGTSCTLTAMPMEGYRFEGWTLDGELVSTDAVYTFNVTRNMHYVANFGLYSITVSVNTIDGGGVIGMLETSNEPFIGSIELPETGNQMPGFSFGSYGQTDALGGDMVQLLAHANSGWHFVGWREEDEIVSTDGTYVFTVEANRDLEAVFESCDYSPEPELLGGLFSVSDCTTVGFAKSNVTMSVDLDAASASNGGSIDMQTYMYMTTIYSAMLGVSSPGISWEFGENQWDRVTYDVAAVNENIEAYYELLQTGADVFPSYMLKSDIDCWHVLTWREWDYLLNQRQTTSGVRYAYAKVNDVCGLVVLPDDWNATTYAFSNPNEVASYENNNITANQWTTVLEPAGAVFLPVNGYMSSNELVQLTSDGNAVGAYPGLFISTNGEYIGGNEITMPLTGPHTMAMDLFYPIQTETLVNGTSLRLAKIMNSSTVEVVAATNQPERGSVAGGGMVQCQENCTVTATTNDGYAFQYWMEGNQVVSIDSEYSFTARGDRNLTAVFAPADEVREVDIDVLVPGTMKVIGSMGAGFSLTFDDGTPAIQLPLVESPDEINMMDWLMSIRNSGEEEIITFKYFINCGSTVNLSWMPGYLGDTYAPSFGAYFADGMDIVEGENSTENLPVDFEVDCSTYNISATVLPTEGGNVTGTGEYLYGANCTLQAVANEGYAFKYWIENGSIVSFDALYTFAVDGEKNLVAYFGECVGNCSLYHISAVVNPAEGGIVTGEDYYLTGETCTVTASSNEEFSFMYWTENGNVVSSTPTYSFVVDRDRNLTAHFTYPLTIAAVANPSEGGIVTGMGAYDYGNTCTMTATPNEGYAFSAWIENGETVSNDAVYCFNVTGERDLVAVFLPTYEITAEANNADYGNVIGGGIFMEGETCSLTATPNDGFGFVAWTEDGEVVSTDAVYEFTVTDNRSLIANFALQYLINFSVNLDYAGNVTSNKSEIITQGFEEGLIPHGWNNNISSYPWVVWESNPQSGSYCMASSNYNMHNTESYIDVTLDFVEDGSMEFYSRVSSESVRYDWGAFYIDGSEKFREGGTTNTWTLRHYDVTAGTHTFRWYYRKDGSVNSGEDRYFIDDIVFTGLSGGNVYYSGETCVLTATPAEGYEFVNWTENGEVVSTDAEYSFTVTNDRNLTANFSLNNYEITVAANIEEGGTVTGAGSYGHGSECTLTAIPNEGYAFSAWIENGEVIATDNPYTFTVTSERSLEASFIYLLPMIADDFNDGIINQQLWMATGTHVVEEDGQLKLQQNVTDNYTALESQPLSVPVDNKIVINREFILHEQLHNSSWGNHYFYGNVNIKLNGSNDNYIGVCYYDDDYESRHGTYIRTQLNGEVTETRICDAIFDAWLTETVILDLSNELLTYILGENLISTISIPNLSSQQLNYYTVRFKPDGWWTGHYHNMNYVNISTEPNAVYTITAQGTPIGAGQVYGGGDFSLAEACTLTAIPSEGYAFSAWIENGETVSTDAVYGFTVTGERSLVAVFLPTYVITAEANNADYGTVTGGGTFMDGETCSLTATPNDGFGFVAWTEDGETVSTDAIYNFTVTSERNLVAVFLPTYEIAIVANDENYGSVTGGGTYVLNESCMVTATPAEGYHFVNWTENGDEVSTDAEYTFTVTNSRDLVANFALNYYDITAKAEPEEGGTVMGAGTYGHGSECTLTATANYGYHFVNWTLDGSVVSTEPNYTFTVTSAGDYTANFQLNNYAINASANPSEGGSVSGTGNYDHGTDCTLTATANVGYTFVNWTLDGVEVGTEPTYTFTVYGEATYVANFSLNLYEITAIANPVEGGTITGAGNYYHGDECILTAIPIENYTFLYWTENGNYLSSEATYSFVATSDRSLVAIFAVNEQTMSLSPGWTWLSSYIEMEGIDGLGMLENGLNPNGVMIKSQRDGFVSYAGGMWIGTLDGISNEKMYLVNTNEASDVTFTGPVANMMNHPITLNHNWTWMGYPSPFALDINDALANLNATEGDVVKSQSSFATYSMEDGWYGSLNTLTPGMGLMYQSHNSQLVTFNYSVGMSRSLKANLTAENNHWVPDVHAYPNNMSIMAVVELNGVELQDERYELAVFSGSECRGSARLVYVPSLRRHVAFLTVAGEDNVELYLALYDTRKGKAYYNTTDCPNFEVNAVLGSLSMPFVARFGSATELDELDAPNIELYPNPVLVGHLFQMEMPAECQGARVSIVNALGAVISTTDVYDEPATLRAPAVPGVYTVRIVTEKQGTFTRKLIVNK